MNRLPDQATLHQLLIYEPDTGALIWRERPLEMFTTYRDQCRWNANYAGKRALFGMSSYGYRKGTLFGKCVTAHRVIWKMVHGVEPVCIDHINHIRDDNRIVNLRSVTLKENARHRNGVVGAAFIKSRNKWEVSIFRDGRKIFVGRFNTKEQAVAARNKAEQEKPLYAA